MALGNRDTELHIGKAELKKLSTQRLLTKELRLDPGLKPAIYDSSSNRVTCTRLFEEIANHGDLKQISINLGIPKERIERFLNTCAAYWDTEN